jgi:hypothetical protein
VLSMSLPERPPVSPRRPSFPPWYGERLDLDHAIWACFANARTREEREHGGDPARRGHVTVYEPDDCDELIRQHLEHAPRRTGPVLIPIQV